LKKKMLKTIFDATKENNAPLVLKYLSDFENHPNERDENGLTCLHYCATFGYLEIAKILISYGANLELKDFISGWTALHRSIYFNHIQFSMFLIHVGAKLDNQSYSSFTGFSAFSSSLSTPGKADNNSNNTNDNSEVLKDHEGKTPLDLLSYQLKKFLHLPLTAAASSSSWHALSSSTSAMNHGIVMSFGKADFTLGIPLPKSSDVSRPKRIDSLLTENIIDVSAAKYHDLAVTGTGKVYSWGNGKNGRLGHGNENSVPEPLIITSLLKIKVIKIATGEGHSLVLSNEGSIYSWGSDRFGQLGHGGFTAGGQNNTTPDTINNNARKISSPKRIDAFKKDFIIDIVAGEVHSLALTDDSRLFSWGSNKNGQLGVNPAELSSGNAGVNCSFVPKRITLPFTTSSTKSRYSSGTTIIYTILQISAGYSSSLLLCRYYNATETNRWRENYNTEVYQWGDGLSMIKKVYFNNRLYNKRSKSGTNEYGSNEEFLISSVPADPTNIKQIATGKYHFVGLSSLGVVYTWGLGSDQLGHQSSNSEGDSMKFVSNPQIVEALLPENGGGKVMWISASGNRTCAVTDTGDLYSWGATHEKGIISSSPAVNYQPIPKKVYGIKRAVKVSVAEDYTLVLTSINIPSVHDYFPSFLYPTTLVEEGWTGKKTNMKKENSNPDFYEYYGDDLHHSEIPASSSSSSSLAAVPSSIMVESFSPIEQEIPSLSSLCQRVLCKSINFKNVLNALSFAERFSALQLGEYCTDFLAR
jgi:alpha-tubulin suppressor-like RCC1 family protein